MKAARHLIVITLMVPQTHFLRQKVCHVIQARFLAISQASKSGQDAAQNLKCMHLQLWLYLKPQNLNKMLHTIRSACNCNYGYISSLKCRATTKRKRKYLDRPHEVYITDNVKKSCQNKKMEYVCIKHKTKQS